MLSLNNIIYMRPQSSYDHQTFKNQDHLQLLFIKSKQSKHSIPCLHLYSNSDQYLLYFHGNAEDLGSAYEFVYRINQSLNINVIVMEYPGYGIYNEKEPSSVQIEFDAECVFIYMQLELRVPDSKIMVFGRSIGSGPACFLACNYQPKALILMSPFTSIRDVAKQHVYFAAYLLKDQFDNIKRARNIECPCLVIHGKKDKLIPYEQSENLYRNLASKRKSFIYPELKDHNDFDFESDLKETIVKFIEDLDLLNLNVQFKLKH